jgi:hypothetical protein
MTDTTILTQDVQTDRAFAIMSEFGVGNRYTAVIEYCDTEADARARMRHFAVWHDSLHTLSADSGAFHKTDEGGNVVKFWLEPVAETEPDAPIQTDRSKAIQAAASHIAARHPSMAAMADKAAAIVESGGVRRLSPNSVMVAGSHGNEYLVTQDGDGRVTGCNCPAYYYRPIAVNGRYYCKHILALAISERVAKEED